MMELKTERTLHPVRAVVAAVVLLLCVTTAAPAAAVVVGDGGAISPLWTVLDWLGLTGFVEVASDWSWSRTLPDTQKTGSHMDPNGVTGSDDYTWGPEYPVIGIESDGGD
jgi:hypothetical protein